MEQAKRRTVRKMITKEKKKSEQKQQWILLVGDDGTDYMLHIHQVVDLIYSVSGTNNLRHNQSKVGGWNIIGEGATIGGESHTLHGLISCTYSAFCSVHIFIRCQNSCYLAWRQNQQQPQEATPSNFSISWSTRLASPIAPTLSPSLYLALSLFLSLSLAVSLFFWVSSLSQSRFQYLSWPWLVGFIPLGVHLPFPSVSCLIFFFGIVGAEGVHKCVHVYLCTCARMRVESCAE